MKRISTTLTIFAMSVITLFVAACNNRDPETEYEELATTVYTSPQEGMDAAQEYLDYFEGEKGCRKTAVSDILKAYTLMYEVFGNQPLDFSDFIAARKLNQEMSKSRYKGVKETWNNLYKVARDNRDPMVKMTVGRRRCRLFLQNSNQWIAFLEHRNVVLKII